jgi:hypothetical protein
MFDPFEENSLTIIISGPKTHDVQAFIGDNRVGYLQRIALSCSADTFLPMINIIFPMLSFSKQQKEILDTDIVIVVSNILVEKSSVYKSPNVALSLGKKRLGQIQQLKFVADVSQEFHNLTLYYSTFVDDLYQRAIKPIEDIEWVNIKTTPE